MSCSSESIMSAVRSARLRVALQNAEKEHELQIQKLKLAQAEESLKLKKELEVAAAEEEIRKDYKSSRASQSDKSHVFKLFMDSLDSHDGGDLEHDPSPSSNSFDHDPFNLHHPSTLPADFFKENPVQEDHTRIPQRPAKPEIFKNQTTGEKFGNHHGDHDPWVSFNENQFTPEIITEPPNLTPQGKSTPLNPFVEPFQWFEPNKNFETRNEVDCCVKPESKNTTGPSSFELAMQNMVIMSQRQAAVTSLLTKHPDMFDGDLLKYQIWELSFETMITPYFEDASDRLWYLGQYTSGKAKKSIEHLLTQNTEAAYIQARKILKDRYGDEFTIATERRRKLEKFQEITQNNAELLRNFSDLLNSNLVAIKDSTFLNCLDNPDFNQTLVKKLPYKLRDRWSKQAGEYRKKHGAFPSFETFAAFVEKESVNANDPILGWTAVSTGRGRGSDSGSVSGPAAKNPGFYNKGFHKQKSAATKLDGQKQDQPKLNCELCSAPDHVTTECNQGTVAARRQVVEKTRLCFGCLKPTSRFHTGRSCRNRARCSICGYQHPTCLHDEVWIKAAQLKGEKESLKSEEPKREGENIDKQKSKAENGQETVIPMKLGSTVIPSSNISLNAVLVRVFPTRHPEKSKLVYAFLDTLANGCFATEELASDFYGDTELLITVPVSIETIHGEHREERIVLPELTVTSTDGSFQQKIRQTICTPKLPVDHSDIVGQEVVANWSYLERLTHELPAVDKTVPVALIIGNNIPKALEPHDCIRSEGSGPYAVKTGFGWTICGPVRTSDDLRTRIKANPCVLRNPTLRSENHVTVLVSDPSLKDCVKDDISRQLLDMYHNDFVEKADEAKVSIDDQKFTELMDKETKLVDGRFESPLPVREGHNLPDNRPEAYKMAINIRNRLLKNEKMKKDFVEYMNQMEANGHSTRVPREKWNEEGAFYIPYHGVYHPQKGKFRAVYDCAKPFGGVSFNSTLIPGPAQELTNNMAGVMIRFRKGEYAFLGDIEKMFYQTRVPVNQRKLLRYFWWPDGNFDEEPSVMEMTCHLFGACSSPSVASYALKRCAKDFGAEFSEEVRDTVKYDFYVDDLLKSVDSKEQAISLIKDVKELCMRAGFNVCKFVASHPEILDAVPVESRAEALKEWNWTELPEERPLGIIWSIKNDSLRIRIEFKPRPWTKRGLLSNYAGITDSLGLIAPFLLKGRLLLQHLNQQDLGWDDEIDLEQQTKWLKWRDSVLTLETLEIARCYKPPGFGAVEKSELHAFADASSFGYGAGIYLRQFNQNQDISCSLVMGKARVIRSAGETVPRSELVAATLAAELGTFVKKHLKIPNLVLYLWTDSEVVIGYSLNETKRFKVFVNNRVRKIRNAVEVENIRYVSTDQNPSDDASRGLDGNTVRSDHRWFQGPAFLRESDSWPEVRSEAVSDDDPEVQKTVKGLATRIVPNRSDPILELADCHSDWRNCVGILLPFAKLHYRAGDGSATKMTDVEAKQAAETGLLKALQREHFSRELDILNRSDPDSKIHKESKLYKLDPILDSSGLIRVGGRLNKGELSIECANPIIIPKNDPLTDIFVKSFHESVGHSGRNSTLNEMRRRGFYVISANRKVRTIINNCVVCRKNRGKLGSQKMASLPKDRFEAAPPFTFIGCDFFGTFYVKDGRRNLKRYAAIFVCLVSRAVHLELCDDLSTDSFIKALRRFIARRGAIRILRTDNGSNFVGANNERSACWQEIDNEQVKNFLKDNNCDFKWIFNTPKASHHGGAWERLILTVRQILTNLLTTHPCQLTTESLRTFLVEVEGIVNSRPLTTETVSDPNSPLALSPVNLLTMKSKVIVPPPGVFDGKADVYSRRQWRRVQHLLQEFFDRFRKEYLSTLQTRNKWQTKQRNFEPGDIVLVKDDALSQSQWPMGRVTEVYPDENGIVRSVRIKTQKSELKRPITKIVLLVENKDNGIVN